MQGECETIVKGFKEAGIVEIIKYSEAIYERVENPRRSPFFFVDCVNIVLCLKKKMWTTKLMF